MAATKPDPMLGQYGNYTGSLYQQTRDLDITEIAKRVRADLKAAVTERRIPPYPYSVQIRRFAGGQSMDITIKARQPEDRKKRNAQEKAVQAVADAYNFDHGDVQADYSCKRFFCFVRWRAD